MELRAAPRNEVASVRAEGVGRAGRGVLLLGAVAQVAIRVQDLTRDPLARVPRVDALHFWRWGGRIAEGHLVGEEPYFSAPLYPYLVGAVRAAGGGMEVLVGLQVGLLLLAALLAGRAARELARLVGAGDGVGRAAAALAVGLLLFTPDLAQAPGRVLAGTLQVLLVTWTCGRSLAFIARPDGRRALGLGAVTGLLCLAWPPTLGALPLLALWAAGVRGSSARAASPADAGTSGPSAVLSGLRRGLGTGAALLLAGALVVLPATLHNLAACGEAIPVTAHGGLTFFHGNNPGADGVITGSGLSMDKARQGHEALVLTRRALGEDAGWGAVSGYFLGRGLDWWRAEPGRAAALALRKAWLFLSGRRYGDIDLVALERESVLPLLHLAFLPAALWVPLGLVGAAVLLLLGGRSRRAALPATLLALVPFGVVTVFWYSPRYRLPALPALALLAAVAIAWAVATWRAGRAGARSEDDVPAPGPRSRAALLAALGLGACSGFLPLDGGVEDLAPRRGPHALVLAEAFLELGDTDAAREWARRSLDLGHAPAARVLAQVEGGEAGVTALRALARARPDDGEVQRALAVALATGGDPAAAEPHFRRARQLDPRDWRARQGLAAALYQLGRPGEAREPVEEAFALAPDEPDVRYTRALVRLGDGDEAGALGELEATLALDADHGPARRLRSRLLGEE